MIYSSHKIFASNVGDLYNEYQEWLDRRNSKDLPKITIVAVNTLEAKYGWFMIITYYFK